MVASCRRGSRVRWLHGYGVSRRKGRLLGRVLAGAGVSVFGGVRAACGVELPIDFDGFFAQFTRCSSRLAHGLSAGILLLIACTRLNFWVGMGAVGSWSRLRAALFLHYYRKACCAKVNPKSAKRLLEG